jgi:hypothetical protein
LGVGTIWGDLGLQGLVEPAPAKLTPAGGGGVIGQGGGGGVQANGLADQVVVVLGT